ncbi:hypothetical protein VTK73DRAFT_9961 [Phialemonium thermophilum]|uniref:Uncharacterized protein n=1 Tax=Phialemonium thermophilum TaxID=223376 RepID=A0ABR3XIC2_9PEZI
MLSSFLMAVAIAVAIFAILEAYHSARGSVPLDQLADFANLFKSIPPANFTAPTATQDGRSTQCQCSSLAVELPSGTLPSPNDNSTSVGSSASSSPETPFRMTRLAELAGPF